jgi:tetratricopeptide (TPR) repeat protein
LLIARAILHRRTGHLEKALTDLGRAIEQDGRQSRAYYERAKTHQLNGNVVQAIEDQKMAILYDPKFAIIRSDRRHTGVPDPQELDQSDERDAQSPDHTSVAVPSLRQAALIDMRQLRNRGDRMRKALEPRLQLLIAP